MMLGETMVTFVADGEVRGQPGDFFPGSDWTGHADLLDGDGLVVANVGSFLVRTGSHVLLVDLGLGPGGRLLDNLAEHGVTPPDVDTVVFTHLHRDHVGWTGAFPRARYLVDQREWDYWCAHPGGVGPDPERVLTPMARSVGFLHDLPAGVEAVPTPGHTPGHTSLLITDAETEQRVLILGDLLHTRAQLDEPGWRFRSDVDAASAERQRIDVLGRYRDGRTILAGGHFAGDVFGVDRSPRARA
jgi:glyoxylase-like metal-dependent hydrolase (beta-lactamase superfamily II)